MNIYKVSQDLNTGYDTYDSFVCVAENEMDAKLTHPSGFVTHINVNKWMGTYSGGAQKGAEYDFGNYSWISVNDAKDYATVELIGKAEKTQKKGVVIASFNAG